MNLKDLEITQFYRGNFKNREELNQENLLINSQLIRTTLEFGTMCWDSYRKHNKKEVRKTSGERYNFFIQG